MAKIIISVDENALKILCETFEDHKNFIKNIDPVFTENIYPERTERIEKIDNFLSKAKEQVEFDSKDLTEDDFDFMLEELTYLIEIFLGI